MQQHHDRQFTLYQHPKGWGLPSVDPNCLSIHVSVADKYNIHKYKQTSRHILNLQKI